MCGSTMGTRKWGTYYHGVNQLWEHYKNVNQFWFRFYPMYIQWIVGSRDIKKNWPNFPPKKPKKKNIELYTLKNNSKKLPHFCVRNTTKKTLGINICLFGGGGGQGEIYYYLSRGQVAPSTTGVDKIDRPVRDVHV